MALSYRDSPEFGEGRWLIFPTVYAYRISKCHSSATPLNVWIATLLESAAQPAGAGIASPTLSREPLGSAIRPWIFGPSVRTSQGTSSCYASDSANGTRVRGIATHRLSLIVDTLKVYTRLAWPQWEKGRIHPTSGSASASRSKKGVKTWDSRKKTWLNWPEFTAPMLVTSSAAPGTSVSSTSNGWQRPENVACGAFCRRGTLLSGGSPFARRRT